MVEKGRMSDLCLHGGGVQISERAESQSRSAERPGMNYMPTLRASASISLKYARPPHSWSPLREVLTDVCGLRYVHTITEIIPRTHQI